MSTTVLYETDGPVATIKLPFRAMSQVHGWWVPDWQLPVA